MDIIYCSVCGKMVPPGGVDDGRYFLRNGEPFCPKCHKQLPPEDHSGATVEVSEPVRGFTLRRPGRNKHNYMLNFVFVPRSDPLK